MTKGISGLCALVFANEMATRHPSNLLLSN